jgi:DNA-binding NarL/FixJ family response regulator
LGRAGIARIGQLRALSHQEWLEVSGVGVKSVTDLARALADPSLTDVDPLSRQLPRPLCPRDREVLSMRAAGATIAEIARTYGNSWERVRLLLARATDTV